MNARHLRNVIETCFPAFTVQSIAFLAEGWSSTVWDVNGTHVFRFPKRPAVATGLLKEMSLLPVLASALPIQIPRFEYAWRGGPAYEGVFVGYPMIPGGMLTERHWSEMAAGAAPSASAGAGASASATAERPGLASRRTKDAAATAGSVAARPLARQLGAFLTALHSFPLQRAIGAGIPDGTPADWQRQCQSLYESARERVFPLLDTVTRRAADTWWAGFLTSAATLGFTPVLIHGDLGTEHILCDRSLGTLTGVIDWEDASIGDPALDFAGLLATLGAGAVEEVLSAYGGPADARLASRAGFYVAVAPFHEVLHGLDTGLTEHVHAGLQAIRAAWK